MTVIDAERRIDAFIADLALIEGIIVQVVRGDGSVLISIAVATPHPAPAAAD